MIHDFPPHVENFFQNLDEILELSEIHSTIAGTTPGRKTKVQILNKSSIVLLTACWEYYIEDLLREAFNFILENAESHEAFPFSVLAKASNKIRTDKDARKVWELAGQGWKEVLKEYQKTTLEKEIDYFHVPRPENINELYHKLLGIQDITKHWYWRNMSNSDACKTLNNYVDLRGEIAHNLRTKTSVRKKDVDFYRKFLNRTAVILHNKVSNHIETLIGQPPWDYYVYGSVR